MNLDTIKDSLLVIEQIRQYQLNIDLDRFNDINKLSSSFTNKHKKIKAQLPYHINVIDLLWANENAHSRILLHLLKQNVNGKYEIFESFIRDLFAEKFKHKIGRPDKLSSEEYRIDLLVIERDKYAIIFENKIHNAVIQKNQMARYIDKVKRLGYAEEQIYIIYLPPDDSNQPNDCFWKKEHSWCKECKKLETGEIHVNCVKGESYEEAFESRYSSISFKKQILPWLKRNVLPNCKASDIYLRSAIVQYIDHLEGLFYIRELDKKMNMELQEYIKEELNFGDKPEQNFEIVKNKINDLSEVLRQLSYLQENTEGECWKLWASKLKSDFPKYNPIYYTDKDKRVGVMLVINDLKFFVLIGKESRIYYGIKCLDSEFIINEKIKTLLYPVMSQLGLSGSNDLWYGWKYTSFEDAYESLSMLIREIEQIS